jgi:hypothetical protein
VPPLRGRAHKTQAAIDFLQHAGRRRSVLRVEPSGTHEQRHEQQRAPGHPAQSHAGAIASAIPAKNPLISADFLRPARAADYISAT